MPTVSNMKNDDKFILSFTVLSIIAFVGMIYCTTMGYTYYKLCQESSISFQESSK